MINYFTKFLTNVCCYIFFCNRFKKLLKKCPLNKTKKVLQRIKLNEINIRNSMYEVDKIFRACDDSLDVDTYHGLKRLLLVSM